MMTDTASAATQLIKVSGVAAYTGLIRMTEWLVLILNNFGSEAES